MILFRLINNIILFSMMSHFGKVVEAEIIYNDRGSKVGENNFHDKPIYMLF